MQRIKSFALLSCLLLFSIGSWATWSIIIVDKKTGAIGIAGASCTNSVYGIGSIVPGKGAIIVQARSNGNARAKVVQMIIAGDSPEKIMAAIRDSKYDPEWQQYAIVTLTDWDHPLTYTGDSARAVKGSLTAKGISVQGNILVSDAVLQKAMDAALEARQKGLSLEETLMLALEAGADAGGDRRCGETKASSAFITVMRPDDHPQKPYLNIVVNKIDDRTNAVKILRDRFNNRPL